MKKNTRDKNKNETRSALIEGLIEIGLTLVIFVIGVIVFKLLGADMDSSYINDESILLVGILVPIAILWIVSVLVQLFKKVIHKKDK